MKRFLRILGIATSVLLLGLILLGWVMNEPLPQGKTGPEADALAKKMLIAVNGEAFGKTRYLEWSFQNGRNRYLWDRELGKVTLKWKEFEVILDLTNPADSKVFQGGVTVLGNPKMDLVQKAERMFHNDSFWLVAPYKVFDKGTQRSIVGLKNGEKALLVTYTTGGTTPGDSYLWLLNDNGFPNAYKMWVKILPIGGIEASWDDWIVVESGAFLPKSHQIGPIKLSMGNVKGYN